MQEANSTFCPPYEKYWDHDDEFVFMIIVAVKRVLKPVTQHAFDFQNLDTSIKVTMRINKKNELHCRFFCVGMPNFCPYDSPPCFFPKWRVTGKIVNTKIVPLGVANPGKLLICCFKVYGRDDEFYLLGHDDL